MVFEENRAAVVLLLAAFLDYLLGDPWGWLHPVQVMGWFIARFSHLLIIYLTQNWQRRWGGVFLGVVLIFGSAVVGWLIVLGATRIYPFLGMMVEVILLASCFALKSLSLAAVTVLKSLAKKDIKTARCQLSKYVGRDTENLSESEILRAVLETVAENATDGVTAPLFYAILGAFIPGVGSVPLALGYKAASTLDSMIGYRQEPFTDIGWFSAQFEDRLTWLPCRLTVLTLALIAGKPGLVLAICRRDAVQDPSPNSGWSECVYAAILGVQLGGVNVYHGVVKQKPFLGDPVGAIAPTTIHQALFLTRSCFLIWLSLALTALLIS
ncbi:MAG: cobalamin biosynthesis protein [Gomphosphaeria aponina SAG 52.96 = DSM 107014]|uniref:Cobalamin biosynthesis protein CobD n=1 Tax=Gomphosphaeria aponina SAG 52.96 = DSM 107014 TaxID=1521640 RepID=A0A941GNC3_9CHRO|nr:cobalamin biosynthesis protein [Gomphosphaeria aponina SAG 52.96 = DSM 107014]